MSSHSPPMLHLDYRPESAGWVLTLQSQLQTCKSAALRKRYESWKESGMAEAGLAVATRLMLVSRAISRLSELEVSICQEIDQSAELDGLLAGGYVYTPKNASILFDICLSIDALLAECLALLEVVKVFTIRFSRVILRKKMTEAAFFDLLLELGIGGGWREALTDARNRFLHESAPWFALEILSRAPLTCGLIAFKRNVHDMSDPTSFITKRGLVEITRGLKIAVWELQRWLSDSITTADLMATAIPEK